MSGKNLIFLLAILIMACNTHIQTNTTAGTSNTKTTFSDSTTKIRSNSSMLIIPGKSIGRTHINESMDSVITALGKPDSSDAAMGAALCSWFAKDHSHGYRTDIYSHKNFGADDENISHVKLIRVTSPAFKTSEDIGVGADFNTIVKRYPVKLIAIYVGNDSLKVYDDAADGIAFEIESSRKCTGILVHAHGDSASSYISLHPDMQQVYKGK